MEQRKAQRYDLRLPLELVRMGHIETDRQAMTRNLSSRGVLFQSHARLQLGEQIEYVITLPNSGDPQGTAHLHCLGRIVRSARNSEFAATLERYEFFRVPE